MGTFRKMRHPERRGIAEPVKIEASADEHEAECEGARGRLGELPHTSVAAPLHTRLCSAKDTLEIRRRAKVDDVPSGIVFDFGPIHQVLIP